MFLVCFLQAGGLRRIAPVGSKRVACLADCQRFGIAVRATCRLCGHVGYPDVQALITKCVMKGSGNDFVSATRWLACTRCGGKNIGLEPWHAGAGMPLELR